MSLVEKGRGYMRKEARSKSINKGLAIGIHLAIVENITKLGVGGLLD